MMNFSLRMAMVLFFLGLNGAYAHGGKAFASPRAMHEAGGRRGSIGMAIDWMKDKVGWGEANLTSPDSVCRRASLGSDGEFDSADEAVLEVERCQRQKIIARLLSSPPLLMSDELYLTSDVCREWGGLGYGERNFLIQGTRELRINTNFYWGHYRSKEDGVCIKPNSEWLSLDWSHIEDVHIASVNNFEIPDFFAEMRNFRYLCMRDSQIATGWEYLPASLYYLDLQSFAKFTHIPAALSSVRQLTHICLTFIGGYGFRSGWENIPPSLEQLDLDWGNLPTIPTEFSGLEKLRRLTISWVNIESLEPLDWVSPNLKELVFNNCRMPKVPESLIALCAERKIKLIMLHGSTQEVGQLFAERK